MNTQIALIETEMQTVSAELNRLSEKRAITGLTFDEDMQEDALQVRYFGLADDLESTRDLDIATSC
jgi:hypothetical protein